jgi:hypothetical protein
VVRRGSGENEPSLGQVERNETVTASNLVIVTDGEGYGVLVGTLINDGDEQDRLVDVDVEGELSQPVRVELLDGAIALPPDSPVRLADDPTVAVSSDRLVPGFRVPLELTFDSSAAIATTVTVEPQTDPYADIEVPQQS